MKLDVNKDLKDSLPGSDTFSVVLFYSYFDRHLIGRQPPNGKQIAFCTSVDVKNGFCQENELNRFIVSTAAGEEMDILNPSKSLYAPILQFSRSGANITSVEQTTNFDEMVYTVPKKGLYCVLEIHAGCSLAGLPIAKSQQPFGQLDSMTYPLLPFYGVMALVYLVLGIIWLVRSAFFWRDILPIQHIVAGLFFVLMIDNAFYFGLYQYSNAHGSVSYALFGLTVVVNAFRVSASIFVVLIVAMGYGVVRPTLGTDMRKCIGISVALFISLSVYNLSATFIRRKSPLTAILVVLPGIPHLISSLFHPFI